MHSCTLACICQRGPQATVSGLGCFPPREESDLLRASYSFSKLRKWLGKHLTSICTLLTHCHSHLLEEVLTLLADYALTRVCLANVDSHVLKLMTEFKFITHCVIQSKERDLTVSLGTLPQLPHMTYLALKDGGSTNLEDVVGLTSLRLRKCMASTSDPCIFMTSLLTLQLEVLPFVSTTGTACVNFPVKQTLQYLQCIQSRVKAVLEWTLFYCMRRFGCHHICHCWLP